MAESKSELLKQAEDVLETNDQGNFTIPAVGLYPHQWLWDSCFIAIGLRHTNIERSKAEILSLLRGQWTNGMFPNMIFSPGRHFRADRQFWRSHLSPYAPADFSTSGITQPPLIAEAVVRIGEKMTLAEKRSWYQTVYPALLKYHRWLYAERSPEKNGLTLCIHPYESGMDNSPPWSLELRSTSMPWWIKLMEKLNMAFLINFFRRDTSRIPPGERMNTYEALGYVMAVLRLRRKRYEIDKILDRPKLVMYDLAFNSILLRANQHMLDIAELINKELPSELLEQIEKSKEALDEMWDGYSSYYLNKSYKSAQLQSQPTAATFLPLYSGMISDERAKHLVEILSSPESFKLKYPVPSVGANSVFFDPVKYWQGPTWVNINWLIIDGLKRYGFEKEAEQLKNSTLDMIQENGMYEYFNPVNGKPEGAEGFSWTAALTIDLVNS